MLEGLDPEVNKLVEERRASGKMISLVLFGVLALATLFATQFGLLGALLFSFTFAMFTYVIACCSCAAIVERVQKANKIVSNTSPVDMVVEAAGKILNTKIPDIFVVYLRGKESPEAKRMYCLPTSSAKEIFKNIRSSWSSSDEKGLEQMQKPVIAFLDPETTKPVALKWDGQLIWLLEKSLSAL